MTFISEYGNISCKNIVARTKEEEKEIRDSYTVETSVKNAHNQEMKKKNY